MTTRVHFVRHAAYDGIGGFLAGRSGVVLGAEGRAQAERLARRLARERIDAVYASPRERTRQTAQILATALALPVQCDAALDEIDFGCWTGSEFASLASDRAWQRWNSARAIAQTPAGDSMRATQARVLDFIESLRREDGTFLLVSHSDVIKAALLYYLGASLDRFDVIDLAPASISTVEIDEWRARIMRLNDCAP